MVFANDRISLPISDAVLGIHNRWTFFNADPVLYLASAIGCAIPFPSFLLCPPQMRVQIAARSFVRQDMLIDGFVTDTNLMFFCQTPGNLLWTEIQPQKRFNLFFNRFCKA